MTRVCTILCLALRGSPTRRRCLDRKHLQRSCRCHGRNRTLDALLMQVLVVRGSKEFTLFPPSQSAHLYPVPHALGTMYSEVPRAGAVAMPSGRRHGTSAPIGGARCAVSW